MSPVSSYFFAFEVRSVGWWPPLAWVPLLGEARWMMQRNGPSTLRMLVHSLMHCQPPLQSDNLRTASISGKGPLWPSHH